MSQYKSKRSPLPFPLVPPTVCPDCHCNTVQTTKEGTYCSRVKCRFETTFSKIERNTVCQCGSGKRFKSCCGKAPIR